MISLPEQLFCVLDKRQCGTVFEQVQRALKTRPSSWLREEISAPPIKVCLRFDGMRVIGAEGKQSFLTWRKLLKSPGDEIFTTRLNLFVGVNDWLEAGCDK